MEGHQAVRVLLVVGLFVCAMTAIFKLRPQLQKEMMRVNGLNELRKAINWAGIGFFVALLAGLWFHVRYFNVPFDVFDGCIYMMYGGGMILCTVKTVKAFTMKIHE